ncbi:DUF7287 family protein [Halorarum halobium]|uniref:DUF7287 family protein n=1 Tax=Halorarum halobium TaxID=3075121 RepID=UPI0028AED52D|nr:hypothetical protein [Halobaculum sp. XH14]
MSGDDGDVTRPPRRTVRSRSVGRGDERGQLLLDYAAGVSVFLLATAFVFAFVPTLFTPYSASMERSATIANERVTTELLHDVTVEGSRTELNETLVDDLFGGVAGPDEFTSTGDGLRDRYELPDRRRINVTLETPDEADWRTVGDPYGSHPVAASTRITVGLPACRPTPTEPSCRLVVRTW